ncbi:TPA: hypothetical protein DF272_00445 [Candidatus Falkowbacteria bacterium]|nr:hypothetical protein [Candidatus Falkowbacteria bacterium]
MEPHNHQNDRVALTSDAIIITDFLSNQPLITLVRRKYEPYKGKLVFPGGHFEPGTFNPKTMSFEGGDASLGHVTSREAREEANFIFNPYSWRVFHVLDRPDRDPRSDIRRISFPLIAYLDSSYPEHQAILKVLQASDDAAAVENLPLMNIHPDDMGFDHFVVIDLLQNDWEELKSVWQFRKKLNDFQHRCNHLPRNWKALWNADTTTCILYINTDIFYSIKFCPFCGADLTIQPFTPTEGGRKYS